MAILGWIIVGLVAGAVAKALGTWLIAIGGALLLLVIYDALSRRGGSPGGRRATT